MKHLLMISLTCLPLFSAVLFSQTYSTDFDGMENPLSEGGAWSHAGLDWKNVQKQNGRAFGTQTGTGGYDDSYAHLSGFPPDQSAFGVIKRTAGSSGIHEVEIHLRWSDSAHSAKGYECLISYDGSYAQIVRWNGPFGDFTYIGSAAHPPVPKTGDTLKATIVGALITVEYNGAEIMRATDSTWKTGNPGMGFYRETQGANSDMVFTSYTATGLGTILTEGKDRRSSRPALSSPSLPSGTTAKAFTLSGRAVPHDRPGSAGGFYLKIETGEALTVEASERWSFVSKQVRMRRAAPAH